MIYYPLSTLIVAWFDARTFENLQKAYVYVSIMQKEYNMLLRCITEIAEIKGYI